MAINTIIDREFGDHFQEALLSESALRTEKSYHSEGAVAVMHARAAYDDRLKTLLQYATSLKLDVTAKPETHTDDRMYHAATSRQLNNKNLLRLMALAEFDVDGRYASYREDAVVIDKADRKKYDASHPQDLSKDLYVSRNSRGVSLNSKANLKESDKHQPNHFPSKSDKHLMIDYLTYLNQSPLFNAILAIDARKVK
ncbi:MAG: hypothetical protein GXP63_04730 [DPANN group archaeon]|nr:hypothetical protein [DPANN group archaeon]